MSVDLCHRYRLVLLSSTGKGGRRPVVTPIANSDPVSVPPVFIRTISDQFDFPQVKESELVLISGQK